uniref:hypothetical protein n=1 Tax=Paractinoplanes polyasparticus TaxID=2856853 RepID=UPI001C849C73|nr:hypothetical protein [Actinoplanes polyasparticus]
MPADGGEAVADLAVLRQQPGLFGPVTSGQRARRVLNSVDTVAPARLRAARSAAREPACLRLLETRRSLPATTVLGRVPAGLVLDIDATIVLSHSAKESSSALKARPCPRFTPVMTTTGGARSMILPR